jgi:Trk K+ transport system NAD-binding subunit
MHSIIIGCGRVGAGLAQSLWQSGQVVIVVDHETTAFERLGTGFNGQTLLGAGLDSDDTNGVLARLARHVCRVPRVVARLHDPRHAEVYQRLGIQAITPHILYAALAAGPHKNALYRLHPQPVNSLKVTAVVGEEGKILM